MVNVDSAADSSDLPGVGTAADDSNLHQSEGRPGKVALTKAVSQWTVEPFTCSTTRAISREARLWSGSCGVSPESGPQSHSCCGSFQSRSGISDIELWPGFGIDCLAEPQPVHWRKRTVKSACFPNKSVPTNLPGDSVAGTGGWMYTDQATS